MDRPNREVLARMPLAEGAWSMWRHITDDGELQRVWDRHRGACYDRVITFPMMVRLIAEALVTRESGHQAIQGLIESGELTATIQAAYGKLGRLPIAVSEEFFAAGAARLWELFDPWACWKGPRSVARFRVLLVDGKAIKNVPRRLISTRGIKGGLLAARSLVVQDWATGLAIGFGADADGEANEVRHMQRVVEAVRGRVAGLRLWILDRAFANLVQMNGLLVGGDHFLTRYAARVAFLRDSSRPARTGRDEQGRSFTETWGWLGSAARADRLFVRRIEVRRWGTDSLVILTSLLDADEFPADDLLWFYGQRWGIESMFQQVTEVFGLQHLIGSTPQAGVFQFAFCLLLYNMLQVLRGYVAEARDLQPDQISSEKLFRETRRQLTAWNVVVDPQWTMKYFAPQTAVTALREKLTDLASRQWSNTWLKSPPQRIHRKTPLKKSRHTHHSVQRLMKAHHDAQTTPTTS